MKPLVIFALGAVCGAVWAGATIVGLAALAANSGAGHQTRMREAAMRRSR